MILASTVLAAVVGCHDFTAPVVSPRPRVQPQWVTGAAAAALDTATGLMQLVTPPGQYVSVLAADSVSLAYVRILIAPGPFNMAPSELEYDRGGPVDFAHLHLCGPSTYESSPFGSFPSTVPAFVQRAWRSSWAIPICGADGTAQLSIGVSDSPRAYTVVGDTLEFTSSQDVSGAMSFTGVPARYSSGLPVTPEEAIQEVYEATSERITTPPVAFDELDDNGFGELPLCASWRMAVEAPVTVRGQTTGTVWMTNEFFVHHAPACFSDSTVVDAAVPDQPTSQWVTASYSGDSVNVPLIGPVRFERVTVVR